MTTLVMPARLGRTKILSRAEVRDMLADRAVAITVVICATVVGVAAIGAATYLTSHGYESAVIGVLIGGPLLWLVNTIMGRMQATRDQPPGLPPRP